ncbi:putative two-component histidine kinase [Nocardia brasiliensis NBRC 14402]|uniref:sensor histidine kinase n=1 Tax=Nocardia brasiliensis TaxID=37326 RepID=UPI0002D76EAD|nr:histidine kinase [Nocardia brasiliensis]ASF12478.1 two-component sensor histidine kinase [Nocardia brasiliensis]GAJ79728.1 putative two-component histidine kinase [Nocardia brasiliensis NBRC 14402]SUB53458.1 Sensor protein degS [Nocardia brasiliensis]
MGVIGVAAPAGEPGRATRARRRVALGWRQSRARIAEFVREPVTSFQRRVEELPFDYPPSVIVAVDLSLFVVAVAAAIQRHSYFPTVLPIIAVLLTAAFGPMYAFLGVMPRPLTLGLLAMVAEALFLLQPVSPDLAPFVLVAAAGEVAAIAPKWVSVPITLAMMLELVVFDLYRDMAQGLPTYVVAVAFGWMAGLMLQYQRRSLYQERGYQDIRAAQAADEERRRIAREVHDVIAHSLSITLLHITAARHALRTDRDVDEAVEALAEAEQLGRQAMADIRRTVGLLDARPSKLVPEPTVQDIEALVGDFARAGLDAGYRCTDDLREVSPAVGLALYRIGQESLANVVKHAPGSTATVRVTVDGTAVALTVDNSLPVGLPAQLGTGMGLSGMRQRAELLGGELIAGPCADGWSVRAAIPLAPTRGGMFCTVWEPISRRTQEGM